MATPQQIETKLRAPRCLNNIPFSARAQCPGTGTKSGRGLTSLEFHVFCFCPPRYGTLGYKRFLPQTRDEELVFMRIDQTLKELPLPFSRRAVGSRPSPDVNKTKGTAGTRASKLLEIIKHTH